MIVGRKRLIRQCLQKSMEYTDFYAKTSKPHIEREQARRFGLSPTQFRRCTTLGISPRIAASVIKHHEERKDF